MTPLIFASYVRNGIRFSKVDKLHSAAAGLQRQLVELVGDDVPHAVFMGRLGAGKQPRARSTRKPLAELLK
jgi:sulfur-carrier protein adenylyltransferase/sulfurtransferase